MTLQEIKKIAMNNTRVFAMVMRYNWGHITLKQLQNYTRVILARA